MSTKDIVERARGFAKPFRVTNGSDFHLKDVDSGDTLGIGSEDKSRATEALATGVEALAQLQDMLYAQDRWRCCSSFRPWMLPGKTARSST
jgi:hypothetical protein